MSDVDDELLALAGGDVSSDEDDAAMGMSRDQSRSPSRSRSPNPPRKDSASKGGVAAKKGNAAKGRNRGSRSDQESDEEGEASSDPGSPTSQQSAPMDESDSDSDAPQARPRGNDDEGNQYPIEGLFRDYEERAKIMGMREIEREQILAERREENERIRQNRMLRQLKVNQEKDFKKRKASAADLDDDQRKTTRVRSKTGETTDKMDSLRRAREERISRKEQRERESDRRKPEATGYGGSPGRDDDDSEVDWSNNHGKGKGKGRSRSPEPRVGPPADLRDVERVRVGRSRFAEVCFYPGFDEAITGCFVRINIGPDPVTRQDVYRMAMIKGFTQGRPYAIPDSRGHQMVVDTYVKAAHGKAQKDWPFFSCSDKGFTESEWERYKKVCAVETVPVPDRDALVAKIADINKLVQRKWTEQELSEKLKRQNDLHVRFSGIERDSLQKQLDAARLRGDDDALIVRLQDRLDSLETPRLAFKTSLAPQSGKKSNGAAGGGSSQQEKLARLNAENRKRNAESVRKAQLVERHKARETNRRHHQIHDEAVASGAATPAKNGADTPGDGGEVGTTPVVMPHIAKLQELQNSRSKNGIPTVHRPLMDDDVIGALDLDIDLEID